MNNLYEVTFSVGTSSDTRFVTTTVTAFQPQQARALIEAQYPGCDVHSVYQKNWQLGVDLV
jgi:hypothetical protein